MLRQTVTHQQREHDGKPMKPVMVRAWDFDGDMMKANLGPVTQESVEESDVAKHAAKQAVTQESLKEGEEPMFLLRKKGSQVVGMGTVSPDRA